MILFCLAAFFFNYVSEIKSIYWLTATVVFSLLYIWQKKSFSFALVLVLFFFAWYRISISSEDDQLFRFPSELNEEIIEVHGTVNSVDSLDIQQDFQNKRQITFIVEINNNSIWQKANFMKVIVQENSLEGVLPGDRLSLVGKFKLPFEKTIPGAFDSQKYYRENKILGNLYVRGWDAIEYEGSTITWRRWVHLGRKLIYRELKNSLSPTNSGLIASAVLGYTSDLDNELMVEFRQWGIAHIFSISGLHLGLVGFWVWLISGVFIISLKKRTWLTIILAFSYCMMSGMAVATVRSLIMLICFLAGYLVNRRTSLWNNFAIAFVLLFLWDPRNVYSAGFQLSFIAVTGILITQEVLLRRKVVEGVDLLLPEHPWKKILFKGGEALFYPLMISLATIGISAYHFQMVSYGSVLLNFLVVPLFSVIMGMSFFYLFLLFFIPQWMVWPLEKTCDLFMVLPSKLTGGAGLFTYVQAPSAWLVAFLFLGFCSIVVLPLSFKRKILAYIFFYFISQIILVFQGESQKDRLVMINVESASSCLVQSKSGANLLFDCGTRSGFDLVSPYLRGQGINSINAVIISHDNYDHFSCWPSVFKNFKIKQLYRNLSHLGATNEMVAMDAFCKQAKIPITNAYLGDQIEVGMSQWKGEVLHPTKDFHGSKNDESILVLLSTDWCEVLFPGDAQEIYEIVCANPLPAKTKPRILVFPHHGRNVKDSQKILGWLQPDLILISGTTITPDVLEVLKQSKIPWMITREYGTIQVEPGLKVNNYRNGVWGESLRGR